MKRARLSLYTIGFFVLSRIASAQLIGGTSPDTVSKGLQNFVTNNIWHYVCVAARWLGGVAVQVLFKVYGWLGTRLLFIPDFSDGRTYSSIGQAPMVVGNLIHIMQWIAFVLLGVFFMFYIGKLALGLNNQTFTILTIGRLLVPTLLIFAWPSIVSFSANVSTSLAFYIFHQNTFNTQNVLDGLNNLDAGQALSGGSGSGGGFTSYQADLLSHVGVLRAFGFSFATFMCVLGIMYGWTKVKEGKEGGVGIVTIACFCLMAVFFTPSLISYFANRLGFQNLGTTTSRNVPNNFNSKGFVPQQGGTYQLPAEKNQSNVMIATPNSNPITAPTTPPDGSQNVDPQDTIANVVGSLVKVFVAIWGVFICIGVLIAKAYQVFSIFIIFFLGFVLIAFLGNPATEEAAKAGFKLFVKLHIYGPVWALALLAMNIVIFVNWGSEGGSGAGSIMTAFMILAGLSIIQNTQDFASIFSNIGWSTGGSAHGFMRDAMANVRTVSMAAAGASSYIPQKVSAHGTGVMGAGAGAVLGGLAGLATLNPGLIASGVMTGASRGFSAGQGFGEHTMKSVHAVSNTLGGNKSAGVGAYAQEISKPIGQAVSRSMGLVQAFNKSNAAKGNPYDKTGSKAQGGQRNG